MKLTCPSCQKQLAIDDAKLPDREVAFPCPNCKTRITVDKRSTAGAVPSIAGSATAAPIASGAVTAMPSGSVPALDDADDEEERGFTRRAMIVGVNDAAVHSACRATGYRPVHVATPESARELYMQEYPPVVILRPAQLTPPPLTEMMPIIALSPQDRRKSFFVLVADGLRTGDGNAAFLYGVNLIVAQRDLGSFPTVFRDAEAFHQRLYQPLEAAHHG